MKPGRCIVLAKNNIFSFISKKNNIFLRKTLSFKLSKEIATYLQSSLLLLFYVDSE